MHQLMEGELWPLLQLMRLTSHFRTRSVGVQTEAGDMPVPSVHLPLVGIITQSWDAVKNSVELIATIGSKYHRYRDFPTAAALADLENTMISANFTSSSELYELKRRLENDLNFGVDFVVSPRGPAFAPM